MGSPVRQVNKVSAEDEHFWQDAFDDSSDSTTKLKCTNSSQTRSNKLTANACKV